MLELRTVTKVFGKGAEALVAVDGLSMIVGTGEIVGLLGSSGCGKTTALRSVAGLVDITSGEISIDGSHIHNLRPSARNVAMAFESYALYHPLKVRENILFALKKRSGRASADNSVDVGQIASMLGIDGILEHFPASLSSGQQQRTSLARALVRRAEVTLLDEPMSYLEPQLRALLRARIKEYLNQHRMTTVFVTHDQNEAVALANRIAVMEAGVLQQFDTPANIREHPANLFVAGFIGEPPMNLIPASFSERDGRAQINLCPEEAQGASVECALDELRLPRGSLEESGAHLGIRPHRVQISDTQGDFRMDVSSYKWLGDQAHIVLQRGGMRIVASTLDGPGRYSPGGSVSVTLPAQSLSFFSTSNGKAIKRSKEVRHSG